MTQIQDYKKWKKRRDKKDGVKWKSKWIEAKVKAETTGTRLKYIGGGMKKQDRKQRAELFIKHHGYLRQDLGKQISSKVIILKITNNDKQNTPYEHLTLRRIESILY